ncbi:MAG: hypothetical protein H5U04_11965 [Firmicutes bacterium]|nr:hypothetical protein [Bacillota bacterium]
MDIPCHFSISGETDLWAPRWAGIGPAPAISLLLSSLNPSH